MRKPIFIVLGEIAKRHGADIAPGRGSAELRELMVEAFRSGREVGKRRRAYHDQPILREACEAGVEAGPLPPAPKIGQRVRLGDYGAERFPHFQVPPHAVGTVVDDGSVNGSGIWVKFDEPIDGCEEWDNEVNWYEEDPSLTLLEAFWNSVEPLS